jgi:hypothetical protein
MEVLDTPSEVYAHLMEARHGLGLKPTDVIDRNKVEQFRRETANDARKKDINDFLNSYDTEDLIKMFNEVASISTHGEKLHFARNGGLLYFDSWDVYKGNILDAKRMVRDMKKKGLL